MSENNNHCIFNIYEYKYQDDERSGEGVTHTCLRIGKCYRRLLKVDRQLSLRVLFSLWEPEQVFNWMKVSVS